jgi:hypothetical protein
LRLRDRLAELDDANAYLQSSDDALVQKSMVGISMSTAKQYLRMLRAVGHCPHMSEPREVVREIRGYLAPLRYNILT